MLSLLESDHICAASAKMFAIDKAFMVTTKITDSLVETVTRMGGIDFYERGANLGYANLLHLALPAFVGVESARIFRSNFVAMMRQRTPKSITDFYRFVDMLIDFMRESVGEERAFLLTPVSNSRICVAEVIAASSPVDLDPIIPSFVSLVDAWGKQLGTRFDAICDEAKAIAADKDVLLALSHPAEPEVQVGHDRRKMVFPLKLNDILMVNSQKWSSIQIADVLAGSLCYALRQRCKRAKLDDFSQQVLRITAEKQLVIDGMFATQDVTPEALDTEELGGSNAADCASHILARRLQQKTASK